MSNSQNQSQKSGQQEASSQNKTVRDFLYVDRDLVTSLYSQLFEGVAESIVETSVYGKSREHQQSGRPFAGKEMATEVSEKTQTSRSHVLYDHLYTRLESRLEDSLAELPQLSPQNLPQKLADRSIVQVTGTTTVADFKYLRTILKNWEAISDAVVEGRVLDEMQEKDRKRQRYQAELEQSDDPNDEARLEKILENIPSEEAFREEVRNEMGLHESVEWNETHLSLILDLWYGDSYEAVVERAGDTDVIFRGAFDPMGLRQKRIIQRLSSAGRSLQGDWTMVGIVQFVPEDSPNPTSQRDRNESDKDTLLRDNIRDIFESLDQMDRLIYQSGAQREVLVRPLSVYQEFSI